MKECLAKQIQTLNSEENPLLSGYTYIQRKKQYLLNRTAKHKFFGQIPTEKARTERKEANYLHV